jgi:hypothetical protein
MPSLVIEYALDGREPGYRFAASPDGLDEQARRVIWRHAMPRGQGWGADRYAGARALKCFWVDERRIALSTVTVTDQRDEMGRGGIRRAEIDVLPAGQVGAALDERLRGCPAAIHDAARSRLSVYMWKRLLSRIVPHLRARRQVLLAHPYHSAAAWQVMEVLVLRIVTSRTIRALEGWGAAQPFTTLALDWREETGIVALPLERARESRGAAVIVIP